MITADFALEQGKDIYVVPGRIGDSLSSGCNKLISQGAGIIWDINQFINEISDLDGKSSENIIGKQNTKSCDLAPELLQVYNYFDFYPKNFSTVLEESGMDYLELLSHVLALERMGLLSEAFKNNYVKQG